MASKQPIRIDTVQIEFDVPKSPFEDIEKSIKDVTSGIDESTKETKGIFDGLKNQVTKVAKDMFTSFENGVKDLEKTEEEIKLDNIKSQLKETSRIAGEVNKAYGNTKDLIKDMETNTYKYIKIHGGLNEVMDKLNKLDGKLVKNREHYSKLTDAYTRQKARAQELANTISSKVIPKHQRLGNVFKNTSKLIEKELNAKIKKTSKIWSESFNNIKDTLQKGSNHIKTYANQAGEHFGKMGQAIGKIPALLAGIGLTVGMKEVLDFMSKMEQTKVDMKFSTTMNDKQLKEAQKLMTESMSKGMTGDLAEMNQAYQLANQTLGLTGKEQQSAAENSIYLSRLLGSDLTEAYAAARQMNDKFGMEANESFNLLSQSKKHGLNLEGNFLSGFNEYSDAFKDLGFNGYEMFDMIKAGMDSGAHSTDKVADGMLEFSIRSKDMTESTAKAYTALGLDADTMFAKFAAGGDTAKTAFKEVTDAIAGVKSDKERNNLAVALFGTMAEDMAPEVFLAMGKAQKIVEEGTGFIDKYAEESSKTWAALWTGATNDFTSAFNTAFSDTFQNSDEVKGQIKQIVTELANGLVKALQWIINNKDSLLKWAKALGSAFLVFKAGGIVGNGLAGIHKTLKMFGIDKVLGLGIKKSLAGIVKLTSKLGGLTTTMGSVFVKSLNPLKSGLKWLGSTGLTGIKTFAKFIGSGFVKSLSLLKAGFLKMIPAIWSAITATWSFTVALLANPITWIVIGVIALIAAIILLIKNWDKVKEVFGKAKEWFTTTVIEPLKVKFQELGQKISGFFSNAWNWIKSVWSAVTAWFNSVIIQPVLNFFRNLGAGISNVFSTAWNWIKSVWSAVTSWFNSVIIQPVLNFFRNLGTGISSAFSSAWNLIKSVWNAVTSWFTNTIINPVKQKFTSLKDGIKTAFSSAWTAVKGIWNKAAGWFEDTVVGPIKKGFDKLKEGWDTVKEGFGTAKSKIGGGLKSVGQAIGIPGLASGGVFEANNPFLAVLGDQTRGNNIETPEGLLRQIVREESHGYTPAGSVSNSVSNSKSSESYNYNPVFNISISGSIDNRNTERKIKEIFKKSMDEYAESMMRRNPRLTGV